MLNELKGKEHLLPREENSVGVLICPPWEEQHTVMRRLEYNSAKYAKGCRHQQHNVRDDLHTQPGKSTDQPGTPSASALFDGRGVSRSSNDEQ